MVRNQKLYLNKEEGFIGTSLKKDEFICDCSDIDDIIVFNKNGEMRVVRVDSKVFVGKDVIHTSVFKKKDSRTIYNMIYRDGKKGTSFIKRFAVKGVTRDKLYNLTQGKPESEILYFTSNPNGEAEIVLVMLKKSLKIKKLKWDLDFADLQIKGRSSRGNIVTKYQVKKIDFKEKGISTLKPRKIWFDKTVRRINLEERGALLGEFKGDEKILLISNSGSSKVVHPEITLHFDDKITHIEKWIPNKPITAIYYSDNKKRYYLKRFLIENQSKEDYFIEKQDKLIYVDLNWRPIILLKFEKIRRKKPFPDFEINVEEFINIKGFKAQGNQLSSKKIKKVELKESLPYEDLIEKPINEMEVLNEEYLSPENDSQIKMDI